MKIDTNIEKAISEYAKKNGFDQKLMVEVKAQIPNMRAKAKLLTNEQINEIKKSIGKDKLNELENIIKSVK